MYLRILLLLALIAGFEPAFVSADEPEWSQFNTLVDEAEIIFRGTVISKEYRDDLEHGGSPFTFYTFEIQEEYKGESPDGTLIVKITGGASPSGKGIFLIAEFPAFSLGGNYMVFLAKNGEYGNPILPGGVFRIVNGPMSGNPVLLWPGRQVLDFDENGPVLGNGRITEIDQVHSDMGVIAVDDEELVYEVTVNFEALFDKLKQHISNRQKESTYKPGKKVNHAPTGNWVIDAMER